MKITQVGISEVVYSQEYGIDKDVSHTLLLTAVLSNSHQAAAVFEEGGVKLRRFSPVSARR